MPAGFQVLLLCLPLAAAAGWAAERIGVPYPVLLVGAGLLLGLARWIQVPELSLEVVFYVFPPPLIYYAAYFIAPADLGANARPIGLLAVGLVVVTMAAVGGVLVGLVPGMPLGWPQWRAWWWRRPIRSRPPRCSGGCVCPSGW